MDDTNLIILEIQNHSYYFLFDQYPKKIIPVDLPKREKEN